MCHQRRAFGSAIEKPSGSQAEYRSHGDLITTTCVPRTNTHTEECTCIRIPLVYTFASHDCVPSTTYPLKTRDKSFLRARAIKRSILEGLSNLRVRAAARQKPFSYRSARGCDRFIMPFTSGPFSPRDILYSRISCRKISRERERERERKRILCTSSRVSRG